jgi:hypothetical protein
MSLIEIKRNGNHLAAASFIILLMSGVVGDVGGGGELEFVPLLGTAGTGLVVVGATGVRFAEAGCVGGAT